MYNSMILQTVYGSKIFINLKLLLCIVWLHDFFNLKGSLRCNTTIDFPYQSLLNLHFLFYLCTRFSHQVISRLQNILQKSQIKNNNGALKYPRHMFMTQKSFTAIKCRINYLQLSNSREYFFSTCFRIQLYVTYHDQVVLHLKV